MKAGIFTGTSNTWKVWNSNDNKDLSTYATVEYQFKKKYESQPYLINLTQTVVWKYSSATL